MAATQHMACASATGDATSLWSSTSGTLSVDTVVKRTAGAYGSWKLNTSSPAVNAVLQINSPLADAGRRINFWVNMTANPAAICVIGELMTAANVVVFSLRLNTNGTLRFLPVGATVVVGTAVMTTGAWKRVSLSYTVTSAASWHVKIYVDGVLDIDADSNGTLTSTGTSRLDLQAGSAAGTNFVVNVDELYIDNGTDLADPGNLGVTAKRPAANNVNTWSTAIGANPANRWTNVNERPLSQTNGWSDLSLSTNRENYILEGASIGDVDISVATLVARSAWVWADLLTGVPVGSAQLTDNGVDTALTLTTTPALYTVITDSASYPSNAAGIGMVSAGSAVDATVLYECGTLIAYTPVTRPVNPQLLRPLIP